jgi:hypothetical protein
MNTAYPKSKRNRHTGRNNAMVKEILLKGVEFTSACGNTYKRHTYPVPSKLNASTNYHYSPIVKVKGGDV